MTIDLTTGRRIILDGDYVRAGHVDHGYAVTIHKAQGVTCDDVFVVGPRGLYRQAGYVALSRARHGAWLYATSHDAAALGERPHTTGIRLPSEPDDDPDADLLDALEHSQAKLLASSIAPHLARIADLATATTLDELQARQPPHRRRRPPTRSRRPPQPDRRTATPRHRPRPPRLPARRRPGAGLRLGQRRHRHRHRRPHRHRLRPLRRPRRPTSHQVPALVARSNRSTTPTPPTSPPTPPTTSTSTEQAIGEDEAVWHRQLADHGIDPDEPVIVPAAIEHRTRQLVHRLAGDQPDWLTWWLGERPRDPAGKQVWDDEVAALATWRDTHHLDDDIAGYGPPPDRPRPRRAVADQPANAATTSTAGSTTTNPASTPSPSPSSPPPRSVERLDELDAILATAPPDQTRILDALHTGQLTPPTSTTPSATPSPPKTADATGSSSTGPTSSNTPNSPASHHAHGPLDHWPLPLPAAAQQLYDQLVTITADTPEPRTLNELDDELADADPRTHIARLRHDRDTLQRHLHDLARRTGQTSPNPTRSPTSTVTSPNSPDAAATSTTNSPGTAPKPACGPADTGPETSPTPSTDAASTSPIRPSPTATNGSPRAVRRWHANHPDGDVHRLHRTVIEIAAYRERSGHTGDDPVGPRPDDALHDQMAHRWERLRSQLEAETPTVALSI